MKAKKERLKYRTQICVVVRKKARGFFLLLLYCKNSKHTNVINVCGKINRMTKIQQIAIQYHIHTQRTKKKREIIQKPVECDVYILWMI